MMEKEFNEERLREQLSRLTVWKQMTFMLACCERMFPNYVVFVREMGWGTIDVIRSALKEAWSVLETGTINEDFSDVEQKCEKAAPNTEDFNSLYVSAALDAAVSTGIL
jgi:hypothetical protein